MDLKILITSLPASLRTPSRRPVGILIVARLCRLAAETGGQLCAGLHVCWMPVDGECTFLGRLRVRKSCGP
jgi:hypothetical protein